MPIYEYACTECGEKFSMLKLSAKEATLCPSCGSAEVSKLVSAFSYFGAAASGSSSGTSWGGG